MWGRVRDWRAEVSCLVQSAPPSSQGQLRQARGEPLTKSGSDNEAVASPWEPGTGREALREFRPDRRHWLCRHSQNIRTLNRALLPHKHTLKLTSSILSSGFTQNQRFSRIFKTLNFFNPNESGRKGLGSQAHAPMLIASAAASRC